MQLCVSGCGTCRAEWLSTATCSSCRALFSCSCSALGVQSLPWALSVSTEKRSSTSTKFTGDWISLLTFSPSLTTRWLVQLCGMSTHASFSDCGGTFHAILAAFSVRRGNLPSKMNACKFYMQNPEGLSIISCYHQMLTGMPKLLQSYDIICSFTSTCNGDQEFDHSNQCWLISTLISWSRY